MLSKKRKVIMALAIMSLLLISSVGAYAAANEVYLFKAPGKVTIDGKLDDWKLVDDKCIVMAGKDALLVGADEWTGDKDLSGKVYFMWDDTALYVAAEIIDDEPLANPNADGYMFEGDCLEVYFSKDHKGQTSYTANDFQIGFSPGYLDKLQPHIWIWTRGARAKDSEIATTKTNNGYIIEAKFAWSNIGGFAPKVGAKVAIAIHLDDFDPSNKSSKVMGWCATSQDWQNPSGWGAGIIAE